MALDVIRIEGGLARGLLTAGILASAVLTIFFAKWCFANAVSTRAAVKEMADLAEFLGPDDPQTHYAAAVLYEKTFSADDLEHSLEEYERAAALSPNNYLSWLALGKARGRNGDVEGAEKAFLRTQELAPNYSDVQWAYGNLLLRAGRMDEGYSQVKAAVTGKPEYMSSATITALALSDGDPDAVRRVLGNTGLVNAALVKYGMSRKQFDEAAAAWAQIPPDEKRTKFNETGRVLLSQSVDAKKYTIALNTAQDIWEAGGTGPKLGRIWNGDFETPIRLKDAQPFDWQIGPGAEPQVGVSDAQKKGGAFSLYMIFNSTQAADMRSISQTVAVEPGKSYTFQVYYRAELKGAVAWEIVDASDGKGLGQTPAIQTVADWTRVYTSFIVPAGSTGITIRLVRLGCTSSICPISGKVWFDDMVIGTPARDRGAGDLNF